LVESGLRPLRPTPAAKSLTMGLLGYYWTQIYPANSIANAFQIVWGNFAQYIVHIGWKRWPLSYQPRVDGIAYFLNCFCYSDQYHLQVLRPIHWTTHCVDRSVHSIRNENSFRKRQYCDAVCVCKLKGGNFKVAVKIISPQASNCNTSYMKDQVFSILDESYATSSGTMTTNNNPSTLWTECVAPGICGGNPLFHVVIYVTASLLHSSWCCSLYEVLL
jgi:hypothetical protein